MTSIRVQSIFQNVLQVLSTKHSVQDAAVSKHNCHIIICTLYAGIRLLHDYSFLNGTNEIWNHKTIDYVFGPRLTEMMTELQQKRGHIVQYTTDI